MEAKFQIRSTHIDYKGICENLLATEDSKKIVVDIFNANIDLIIRCLYSCVRLYLSTVKASVLCSDILDILECMDQRSCVKGIILDAFVKFLHLSFWIYYILPPKTKIQQADRLEKKWNIWYSTAQICMKGNIFDIGYKWTSC